MCESIEESGGELLVAGKDVDPLGKGQIGGHHGAAPLVAIGDEVEEQLAAGAIEGHEAEFVDDEQLDPVHPSVEPRELALIACLDHRADEIGSASEEHAATQLRGLDPERDGKMRFAGADRAGKDEILGARDPLAAGELGDDRGTDGSVTRSEVEAVEGLGFREACFVQAMTHGGLEPRRLLGGSSPTSQPLVVVGRTARWDLERSQMSGHVVLSERRRGAPWGSQSKQ